MNLWTVFKGHWQLVAILAVVFALWNYPVMYPLKMLVVFLHEASHAFAAILTGGEVLDLSLDARQGGSVTARGGNGFIITSAGYLGSLFLGALLLVLALRSEFDRIVIGGLGVMMLALTALYVRTPFTLFFCLSGAALALISARFLGQKFNDLLLRLIGLTCMVYVPYDIFSDTLSRAHLRSDARILAENYGGTTMLWGVIWLLVSLMFLWGVAKFSLRTPSNIDFKSPKEGQREL